MARHLGANSLHCCHHALLAWKLVRVRTHYWARLLRDMGMTFD